MARLRCPPLVVEDRDEAIAFVLEVEDAVAEYERLRAAG
ncbi:hypothetical protein EV378_5891 [Pseudonocardia endophytica]|uniref:Uncharacterized protein n=1 Tax=Pseudonocardia endophytica TaxID=401976 RepID=A0A4R1HQ64_PSEEN|nr:hypothetical protein EV378_5891 [Pseudonocardia endophytica]